MIFRKVLLLIGSGIFLLLASGHLYYTFFTDRLYPRKEETIELMKNDSMNLTNKTTVWSLWIGFNGSHSLGGIFLGLVNILLVLRYPMIICDSVALLGLNVIISASYLFLAKMYWFNTPLTGISIATLCYVLALLSAIFK